jgi:exoribonuclease II
MEDITEALSVQRRRRRQTALNVADWGFAGIKLTKKSSKCKRREKNNSMENA